MSVTQPEMEFAEAARSDSENQYVMNYTAPWEIYSISFACRKEHPYRLAIGSLKDEESNSVDFTQSRSKWFKQIPRPRNLK